MSGVRRAAIRFYGDLAEIASNADRDGQAHVPVERPRSVKDAIESCGVPHTEVDLVLVDGCSVSFGAQVEGGSRVSAYPPFLRLDVPSLVRPASLDEPRFALDVHLGRLAERLRILGFDTLYGNDLDDDDLEALSVGGPRWLLTRDRGLLMRRTITHGYLVRSSDPQEQALEVVRRFRLGDEIAPFTRCARCNGVVGPVDKEEVLDRLEPATRAEHDTFTQCRDCGQVYWPGTHLSALRAFVERAREVS